MNPKDWTNGQETGILAGVALFKTVSIAKFIEARQISLAGRSVTIVEKI